MQQRGFVEHEDEQIYFESWGSGDAVVLGHGLGGSHAVWYQQVAYLAQSYQVITWDQRGFGRSTRNTGEVGAVPATRDLKAVLDHLGIEQAHIIGQSMGGWSALGFAITHPERTVSLTLADTTAGITSDEIDENFATYAQAVAAGPPPEDWELGEHPAVGTQLAGRDLAHSFLYAQLGSLTTPPPPAEIMPLLMQTSHMDRVGEVTTPTLFVVGENDPIFSPTLIKGAATVIPHSRVEVISNTGHSPYFESPAEWNRVVGAFLQQSGS